MPRSDQYYQSAGQPAEECSVYSRYYFAKRQSCSEVVGTFFILKVEVWLCLRSAPCWRCWRYGGQKRIKFTSEVLCKQPLREGEGKDFHHIIDHIQKQTRKFRRLFLVLQINAHKHQDHQAWLTSILIDSISRDEYHTSLRSPKRSTSSSVSDASQMVKSAIS